MYVLKFKCQNKNKRFYESQSTCITMENGPSADFVNVAVRIRPLFEESPRCLELVNKDASIIYIPDRAQAFTFDTVFDEEADQETVYQAMVKPLVDRVKEGYNCTVFAYGQTGTGKTYTMGSSPHQKIEDAGLITRAVEDFFFEKRTSICTESELFISFSEIYNEKVYDLLGNQKVPLAVKEFKVQGLSRNCVKNPYEAIRLLEMGSKNRHVGGTKQNCNSSRSHAIFTIHCTTKYEDHETVAKLNLVDLAGSESVKKTGNQGSQLHEGININKGLLCIGQVMNALSRNNDFVPYRQSMITTILQDSLNKTNYVTLVACISPNHEDVHETVHTLDFASRAKKLKNMPELNKFKRNNPQLFCKSVTKSTPRIERNLSCPTPSTTKKRKLAELDVNSLPVLPESCKSSFLKGLGNISSSTAFGEETHPVCSTPCVENKENLQSFHWSQVEATVVNLVRNEFQQLQMSQTAAFEEILQRKLQETTARKTLNFSSPLAEKLEEKTFKVPEMPKRLKAKATSSPNEREYPPKLRRSTRLSLKKKDVSMDCSAEFFEETFARRRSVRLFEKNMKVDETPTPVPRKRIATEEKSYVPTPAPRRKVTKTKSSPRTAHSDHVFDIINNGNEKQLQKLATIGPKTASLICTFRGINGKFSGLSDLEKLPFWGKKTYERFCKANFVIST